MLPLSRRCHNAPVFGRGRTLVLCEATRGFILFFMNVILHVFSHDTTSYRWTPALACGLRGLALAVTLLAASARAETHANLQAVNANGVGTWAASYPLTVQGVLLTDPEEMLDSTANFQPASAGTMGGEWQIVVQAAEAGDRGGTACWMGQNYATRRSPGDDSFSYSNEAWLAEIARLNHDPATGHAFRKGDLVSITANGSLFYGGKRNINEMHRNEPNYDFTISLVTSNYGLPAPEVLSLTSLVRTNDNNPATSEDIFDAARATGGEHWQGMRVRLNGLRLLSTDGWNPTNTWGNRLCMVTDDENRLFRLRHPRYSLGTAPTDVFDAIGIINQESGSSSQGTNGYELFVQEILPSEPAVLSIAAQPQTVIIWPGSLANYQLYYVNSVAAEGTWEQVTNVPALVNDHWTVILDFAEAQARFFRLQRVR